MAEPAPFGRAVAAQTAMELRLTARRGENLLAMIGIPVTLLLLLGSVDLVPIAAGLDRTAALLPGILALAIVATGLVNLGIATAYERNYGVLRRLGGSPLGIAGLVVAKLVAVLVVEVVLAVVLVVVAALVFGWRPTGGPAIVLLVPAVILGTAAFAGLGLALAGALRAEAVLLVANILFLLVIGLGGVVVPLDVLPEPLAAVASVLPAAALRDAIAGALGAGEVGQGAWVVLVGWATGAAVVATRAGRWD